MEDSDSDESEGKAVSDEDPDWQKTPLFKRIKKVKGQSIYDVHKIFSHCLDPSAAPLCPYATPVPPINKIGSFLEPPPPSVCTSYLDSLQGDPVVCDGQRQEATSRGGRRGREPDARVEQGYLGEVCCNMSPNIKEYNIYPIPWWAGLTNLCVLI